MAREHCYACGKPEAGSRYCGYCGVEQSGAAQRHHRIMRRYHSAAKKAVDKADTDREVYGGLFTVEPSRLAMVHCAAEHVAETHTHSQSIGALQAERVMSLATGRLQG